VRDAEHERVRPTLGAPEGRAAAAAANDSLGAQAALLVRRVQEALHRAASRRAQGVPDQLLCLKNFSSLPTIK
jgi:hypothetical protein